MKRREFGRLMLGGAATAVFGAVAKSADAITLPYVYGAASGSLPRWVAARQRVLSGQGPARICCIGDSTTYGSGSPDGTGSANIYRYSYQCWRKCEHPGGRAPVGPFAWRAVFEWASWAPSFLFLEN